ncbi:type II secretion system F family protein [Patescibacteria group bacterium]|nr:type II secretion system F family protein [Patescibacteria group bacterium]MBU1563957.1 type II secretion system F family protein [Patescibacteria group bacterium]
MKFNYIARNKDGETQSGIIKASSEQAALKSLQDHSLVVVSLKSFEEQPIFSKRIKFFERVNRKDAFVFFRQLAILVDANVPLVQSLKALGRQVESDYFKEVINEIANNVDGGMSLSSSFAKYPKVFSIFSINLIKTGEVSGQLQESLIYLADHLENEYYLISKVRGAMSYPAFILGAFVIVGVLVMVMVIPQLTSILTEAGQELPWTTKIVIFTSNFIRGYGWILLILAIGGGVGFWKYKQTEKGRVVWDTIKIKIPLFGPIFKKTYLARLSDNLSALIKGGVSIIQSLNVSGEVVGNSVFKAILFKARDDVKEGKSISSALEGHDEFPPLFTQMIKTGEQTGKLDSILGKLSVFYSKEVENVVDNLSRLIEPILLVALGIGVSILVFSVFMPIYNLAGGM